MSQLVILLRYVNSSGPVERFISFVHIQDRTSEGLASVLKLELEPYDLELLPIIIIIIIIIIIVIVIIICITT
jgi:hypothetical protein